MKQVKTFLIFMFFGFVILLFPDRTKAQVCSGAATFNWTTYTCERISGAYTCVPHSRTDYSTCSTSLRPGQCVGFMPQEARICNAYPEGCEIRDVGAYSSEGCYWSSTPTPTSTPPGSTGTPNPTSTPGTWGSCGSCGNCNNNPPGSGNHPSNECILTPEGACTWDISCRGSDPSTCDWDRTGPEYPSCEYGLGNSCSPSCNNPPYTTGCSGCSEGLVNIGGVCLCPEASVDLKVNGSDATTVPSGSIVNLTWSSRYVNTCTASGSWTGNIATNNSTGVPQGPLSTSAVFSVNCTGSGGSASDSVTVTVTATPPPTPTTSITAAPNEILLGGSSTLTWSSTNADFCLGSGGWTGDVGTGGTTSVSPTTTSIYHIDCISAAGTASDSAMVTVRNLPWWQAKGGSVYAGGNISTTIPTTCSLPTCNPYLIADGGTANQYHPGIAIYGGSSVSPTGQISSKGWLANSLYNGRLWTYNYFASLVPRSYPVNSIPTSAIGSATLDSASPTDGNGYTWYKKTGDLTISSDIVITAGKKVILLVEGGNLYINGKINLSSSDEFFMAIVGERSSDSGGNIIVSDTVSSEPSGYTLEGVYFADNNFHTGGGDSTFRARGSVSSDTFNLGRDGGGATTPSELFEYAPEIMVNYPDTLNPTNIAWKEIAP